MVRAEKYIRFSQVTEEFWGHLSSLRRVLRKQWCGISFRKSPRPSLPLKRAPPLISVFSPQGRRGNRSSSSLWTISFYGWRTIRGLRQQQSCGFLCGDEPALRKSFWWERRDTNKYLLLWTRFHFSLKDLLRGCLLLWDSLDRWW